MKTNRFARLSLALLAGVSVMTLASIAEAQQAYVSVRTTLRAGPDRGYPQVAWLGGGTTVYVNGCVRGYHWCDVTAGGARGWANARHLQYYHHNRRVAIYGNGATFGFPVVGFALGSYWDNHYRSQAWYNNRSHWNSWHPGRPAPRFDNYPAPRPHYDTPRPHYAQPHAVAPAPRPYVREVAPPNAYRAQPYQPPVQHSRPHVVQQQPQQFRAQAQPQPRAQPQGRPVVQEQAGKFPVNGSLR